jgi:hypothetical protein
MAKGVGGGQGSQCEAGGHSYHMDKKTDQVETVAWGVVCNLETVESAVALLERNTLKVAYDIRVTVHVLLWWRTGEIVRLEEVLRYLGTFLPPLSA